MNTEFVTASMIKLSSEIFLCSGDNNTNLYLIDPKTSGILETFSGDVKVAKGGLGASDRFGNILAHQSDKTILLYFNMLNVALFFMIVINFEKKKPFLRASLPEKLCSFCFSADEYFFYGGAQSGMVYIWDCVTGELLHKFQAHHKATTKILATKDGGTIITAGEDYTINTWNVEQYRISKDLLNTYRIFCKQSQWNLELNSVGLGEHAKIKPHTTLLGHTHYITDMKITEKKNGVLASCSIDKTCRIWNYSKGVLLIMLNLESPINCICLDPFEDFVFIGCKNHNIYSHRITQDRDVYGLALKEKQSGDSKLQLSKHGLAKKAFTGCKEEVTVLAYYQEENLLLSGSGDGKIIFWNLEGNMVKQINILNTAVTNIHVFKRPYEFEKNESFLKQKKRPFELPIFKKYEEDKISLNPVTIPLIPQGDSLLQKRIRVEENDQPVLMKFVKASFPFFEVKGKEVKATTQSGDGDGDEKVKALREENEKLLKMNEKLFSLCFLKEKI